MKKITLLSTIFLLIAQLSFSQEIQTSKRISIPSPTKNVLLKIKASGIDLSCGPKFVNNNLEMELSYQELQSLKKNGINYNVLIPNLSKFYKDRNAVDLPKAKANLNSLKTESRKRDLANKSLSLKSTLINNPAQHDECSEINWTIPTNFQLGSMGGCLTVSETLAQLDLMRTLYPNLISVKTDASSTGQTTHGNSTGATTWPGQTIYYVRISDNPDSDEAGEPETLITGMMHAREANSLMNIMYFMWYILENYNSDPFIKNMVDNQELYFMPISNPDGVRWNEVIAPGGGGLQRKNLGPDGSNNGTTNSSNNARGIDLNRNFNYYWGWDNSGSSPSANSQTFRGTSAGSEPETQIIKDFISNHDIKVAVNHHGGLNSIVTSSYNGNVSATDSGREDEYAKICHDLTQYNRYIYGSAPNTLYEANGDVNDWMLGGTSVSSGGQTSSGSGKNVLALTPENGDDFWPAPSLFTPIAQRAMRMNFIAVMHSGKFAELHDLNNSNISTTSGNLNFGVEYLGKTYGDITLTVTPVSTNIISITSPLVQSGWSKLEQRNLNIPYVLNAAIQPNDEIEFQVTLSNDDFIIYQANYVKYYQPTLVFQDNDTDTSNWTTSGGTWGTTADAHIGSVAITDSPSGAYSNNVSKSITLSSPLNLSSYSSVLVQFYAKWELERNYDLVQLEASTDSGSNWTALCGSYNKPSATELTNFHLNKNSDAFRQHQSTNGDIVYDGDSMNKWVMEEIHINSTENNFLFNQSNVQLRFRFKSDSSNREDDLTTTFDGFIFDDFKVVGIQTQCIISVPTGLASNNVTTNNVSISWNNIPSATYDLRYREIGTTTWTNINGLTVLTTNLTGLNSSTDYEVQARSNCGVNNSAYTSSTNFTTTAVTYCTSEGNNAGATDEFISNVLIKTINNTTGNDSYSDFTSKSTDVTLGKLVSISITPTWSNIIYNEAYSVWIDYNRDGDFSDPGENVWTKSASKTTPVSGNFTIPLSATVGTTRMRVSMKYNGIPTECETFQYGEVEDYTIIIEGTGPDVTVPVITLNGASPIDINQGVTYTELGATAIDNVDGDITANIIVGGVVDVNTAGSYFITYDVSDNAGNIATQVIRTVNIIPDTTAPVITINGASTINLNLGTTYTEQGATASDDLDGDITANIIVGGAVDVNTAGSYFITYDVSDNAGNIATQVIRTVNIIPDTTAPVITINGASTINLNLGTTYTEQGATASDDLDGDITANIIVGGAVDVNTAGSYFITYDVSDNAGNIATQVIRTVNIIPDTTAPVITINGASTINLNLGTTYTEQGATASDDLDGDITANIIVGGAVDVNTAGSYFITYDVSDNAGNIATQVIRTVNIIPDTTAPVITINGASTINLNLGTTYTEQGATASDDFDGDITANIIVGGAVDVNTAGSYFITYDISDNAGNIATQVIRTVNIIEVPNGCVGGISSFPYTESFENTLGDWTQSAADDIDWTIDANGTPSNNTGPSSATDGTYYLYVEASSPNFPSVRSILNSPCFDLSALTKATFSFSYHMYGAADMGTIDLEISDDDGLTWTSIWSQSDNQGNSWLNVNVNLSTYVGGGVQLRFNRFIGSTWQADIAIDNISLIDEEFIVQSCTAEIASFPYNEGFESTLGGWSQSAADDMDWTIGANGTPSSNTGPSSAIEGTNYLYVEASTPNFPSKRAIVNSPCFDLSLQSSATFSFNYHQYGSTDMGTLNLEASIDNGNSWSSIWNSSGNLGNSWQSASVDLSAYLGDTVQLRFNRFIGGTWQADIAIDNINLTTSSAAKGPNDKLLDINNNTISNFLIYPNPVKGDILNIKLSKSINVSYKIINMLGQIVNTGKITKEIPVGNLQEGTYFIQVNDGERIYTEKFVKD